jgi:hypothetical protein
MEIMLNLLVNASLSYCELRGEGGGSACYPNVGKKRKSNSLVQLVVGRERVQEEDDRCIRVGWRRARVSGDSAGEGESVRDEPMR